MVANLGGEVIDWLIAQGVVFDPKVLVTMGSAMPRQHHATGNGPGIINTLAQTARKKGVKNRHADTGDRTARREERAHRGHGQHTARRHANPICGTLRHSGDGRICANQELVRKLCPRQADAIWAASSATTGDGLLMALKWDADTLDLDVPWLTPTVEINSKSLITSNVLSKGGILVNAKAQRFTKDQRPMQPREGF